MKKTPATTHKNGLRHRRHPWFPLHAMAQDLNHFFEGFPIDGDWASWHVGESDSLFSPSINIEDDGDVIRVTSELPGMTEKNIEVELSDNTLILRGKKESEAEEEKKNYYRKECSYGAFHRVIPLPCDVNPEKVQAKFDNGLLKIDLPKSEKAKEHTKKIAIQAS